MNGILNFFAMLIYFAILAISAICIYHFLFKSEESEESEAPEVHEKHDNGKVLKSNVNYDGANVMTAKGPGNVCVAIFKNPVDHKTHFYRTRLKGTF